MYNHLMTAVRDHAEAIILIASAVAAFVALRRRARAWLHDRRERARRLDSAIALIDSLWNLIGPNGGTSIHDRLVAIDRMISFANTRSAAALAAANIASCETNARGGIVSVNAAMCRLARRTEHEFMDWNWINIIDPDEQDRVVDEWRGAVASTRTYETETVWVMPDGSRVSVAVRAIPSFDSAGKIIGWVCIVKPITENPVR